MFPRFQQAVTGWSLLDGTLMRLFYGFMKDVSKRKLEVVDVERTFDTRPSIIKPEWLCRVAKRLGLFPYLDRAEFYEFAKQAGTVIEIAQGERIKLDGSPLGDRPKSISKCLGTFELPRTFVSELTGCTLAGDGCLAITEGGNVILESSDNSDMSIYKRTNVNDMSHDYLAYRRRNAAEIETLTKGPYFRLAGGWSQNYYHWLMDYLPQIRALEQYTDERGEEPTILLAHSPPQWLQDSLRILGYGPSDWIEWNGGVVNIDRLVLSTHTRYSVLQSTRAVKWLVDRIRTERPALFDADDNSRSRIYISRSDADQRHVANDSEVLDHLEKHGFKRYVLSELTFEEQISLFSNAEAIIGPHGAGLVNMIFADSPHVVEIFGEYTNPCYYCLATGLGYEYTSIVAETQDEEIVVDVDTVLDSIPN